MGDSDATQNNFLLHSVVNQSRINESINQINLFDLMNEFNPGPAIKKLWLKIKILQMNWNYFWINQINPKKVKIHRRINYYF
ncbi:unnamed protein product [Paramecium octaurelia]|uniref:Uncharacterized protein n=1 Tax=Paramecium octaurelia TaxID=43137 RepID=A0A8S1TUY4_PAROT|nr:unnamed protein product [Paramecium octaurelia]